MKIGVNTLIWSVAYDESVRSQLPLIAEAGFDGIEVPLLRTGDFPASQIRKDVASQGLDCTICAVLVKGLSLISDDAAVRANSRRHVEDAIKCAADTGAKLIAGPLYCPVGYLPGRRRTQDEWNRALDAYQAFTPTLEANDMTLAIEPLNRFETFFLNTACDAARMCDQIGDPRIGILFDTFHANIEEKDIAAGLQVGGRHLKHVHISENDRGTPGSGHVAWDRVFQALRELDYNGWLTIESFAFAIPEISAAASIWRDIERTPGQIAYEGVKFLKAQTA
jgi:D-psicose/D-tagatose/L-ribulose 3-epimerase